MVRFGQNVLVCQDCSVVSCNLSADQAIYDEKYWSHYRTLGNSSLGGEINKARANLVRRYVSGQVLDFGCGAGTFINRMRKDGGSAVGFDINPFSGNCIIERLFAEYSGVTFWDSIEHLDDPATVLRGLDADHVFICTPNADNFKGDFTEWRHYKPTEHVHYFNEHSLRMLLESTGYSMVEVSFEESLYRQDGDKNIITVVGKREQNQPQTKEV
jgi:2-polyprenyl-3-methyl-5-hydroxy-6-metoxy-1,4-benzoquinol methylase